MTYAEYYCPRCAKPCESNRESSCRACGEPNILKLTLDERPLESKIDKVDLGLNNE